MDNRDRSFVVNIQNKKKKMDKYTYYLRVTDEKGNKFVIQGGYSELENDKILFGKEILSVGWNN